MGNARLAIIYFGNAWDDSWRRRQQIAYGLSKKDAVDRVLYVELAPLTLSSMVKYLLGHADPDAARRWPRVFRHGLTPRVGKVHILSLLSPLPLFGQHAIGRAVRHLAFQFLFSRIQKLLKGADRVVLWVGSPYYPTSIVGRFREDLLVYDCADEHWRIHHSVLAYSLSELEQHDAEFKRSADLVFTNSEVLYAASKKINASTYFAPNGVDVALFRQGVAAIISEEIKALPHPLIGYVGSALDGRQQDIGLLLYLAEKRPDWSFVFLCEGSSPPHAETRVQVERLKAKPNVHFLGFRPYGALPQYVTNFDVCINVFLEDSINATANSLKQLIYLAAGRPVVSTNTAGASRFDLVRTASRKEDFLAAIERALAEDSPELQAKRRQVAEENSWDSVVNNIYGIVERHLANAGGAGAR